MIRADETYKDQTGYLNFLVRTKQFLHHARPSLTNIIKLEVPNIFYFQ